MRISPSALNYWGSSAGSRVDYERGSLAFRYSEKRIDEWSSAGTAQCNEQAKEQKYDNNRSQPPFLVMQEEIQKFRSQARRLFSGQLLETVFLEISSFALWVTGFHHRYPFKAYRLKQYLIL